MSYLLLYTAQVSYDKLSQRVAHIYTQDLLLPYCGSYEYAGAALVNAHRNQSIRDDDRQRTSQLRVKCFDENSDRQMCSVVLPCTRCIRAIAWGIQDLYCHDYLTSMKATYLNSSYVELVDSIMSDVSEIIYVVGDSNGYSLDVSDVLP